MIKQIYNIVITKEVIVMKLLDRLCVIFTIITFSCLFIIGVIAIADLIYRNFTKPDIEVQPESTQVIVQERKNYYEVTNDERYLLAKLAHAEASICSEECQRDVISVVFNRLESGKWCKDINGDGEVTLYDIIYYPNAFTPATNGAIDKWEPTEKDYRAVDYVIKNGPTVPTEVRYFRTDYDFKWEGYKNYKVIDNTYFGYFEDWRNGAW